MPTITKPLPSFITTLIPVYFWAYVRTTGSSDDIARKPISFAALLFILSEVLDEPER